MTGFPGSPLLVRGAILGIDKFNPAASVVVFQYNPDTLTRRVTAAEETGGRQAGRSKSSCVAGAPTETISLEIELDATDQMERGSSMVTALGIHPQLAALEMLLYPKSGLVIANAILARAGSRQIMKPEAPLTLFVWGPKRVLPVRLTELSITEEAYDAHLNPIRAKVSLSLKVLTYSDVPVTSAGGALFLGHQVLKETMAGLAPILAGSALAQQAAGG